MKKSLLILAIALTASSVSAQVGMADKDSIVQHWGEDEIISYTGNKILVIGSDGVWNRYNFSDDDRLVKHITKTWVSIEWVKSYINLRSEHDGRPLYIIDTDDIISAHWENNFLGNKMSIVYIKEEQKILTIEII